ncbi:Magnesium and cobalt transport protein CorA [Carbonactinospora thermoautotrophica]|uniref:Magnesium transport protein CorA n=1 Tax=Carbonactinospora thermoautotrophica TaxID=1469144 RepID=A0A132MVB7_9ACTN|nr:Magnesium and cobalt transport protein CorA [Carbonactinospora thermoautotrophica]
MIVDCALYRAGARIERPQDLSEALDAARARGDTFLWLGLYQPTPEELDLVARELKLHPLAVEDAIKAHQRPKLEQYEDSLFCVVKTLLYRKENTQLETGEVALFLGDGFAVTVRHGEANPLHDVRLRMEQQERDVLRHGPASVLYAVCDAIVDTYGEIVAEIEQDLEELEAAVFAPHRKNQAERIYLLKREVLEFRRAAVPLLSPMRQLAEGHVPGVAKGTRPFFRDVNDHLQRVVEAVESFDRLLGDILSANLAQVSVRQNDDLRKISAWVAIIAVPTMVAGIYGMNFEHMPELKLQYGYPLVLLLMLTVCAALYRWFKRSGWL